MKKRFFTIFLALVAGVVTLFASDTQVDGIFYVFNGLSLWRTASGKYHITMKSVPSSVHVFQVFSPTRFTTQRRRWTMTAPTMHFSKFSPSTRAYIG